MIIDSKNTPTSVCDKHFTIKCPHCNVVANVTAVSIPRYEILIRLKPTQVGIGYRCDACNKAVFLRFQNLRYDPGNFQIHVSDEFEEVERPNEQFEFEYLKGDVRSDFVEALSCFSHGNMNAFAAMCRRTVQSICVDLGAAGKDKVMAQLKELQGAAEIDDQAFAQLSQIIIDGHDGAHPHLPKLNADRAAVLLELMKDVLYQVYVRKAKIQEAVELRKQAIATGKTVA